MQMFVEAGEESLPAVDRSLHAILRTIDRKKSWPAFS
jgi:hypothetical protein